jgi:hypothetical protein
VRSHPELDEITECDKDKLTKVIGEYNEWYGRNVKVGDRSHPSQARWAYAQYEIQDDINKNMVEALSTLEETQYIVGKGYSYFPVGIIFSDIDTIREELLGKKVHPTLLQMEPALLMDILNKLEICTRHVIQNTSIRRLHKKSWAHADALAGNHGGHAVGVTDAGENKPVRKLSHLPANASTLLRDMKQLYV